MLRIEVTNSREQLEKDLELVSKSIYPGAWGICIGIDRCKIDIYSIASIALNYFEERGYNVNLSFYDSSKETDKILYTNPVIGNNTSQYGLILKVVERFLQEETHILDDDFKEFFIKSINEIFARPLVDLSLERLGIDTWNIVGVILEQIFVYTNTIVAPHEMKYLRTELIGNNKKIYDKKI